MTNAETLAAIREMVESPPANEYPPWHWLAFLLQRGDEAEEFWDQAERLHMRTIDKLRAAEVERDRLREALTEIAKGEGPFSRDPLTHATNTIESMVAIATAALAARPPEEGT